MKKINKPKSPNKTKAKARLDDKLINAIRRHKLVSVLLFILIFSLSASAHTKYKDWDNAQALRGLNRDFPILIEQIEQATGLDLQVKSNCSVTQEKFGGGVNICQYIVSDRSVPNSELKTAKTTLQKNSLFSGYNESSNGRVVNFKYRKISACEFSNSRLYISCQMGVRDANKGIKY